jgi:FdrA protein
MLKTIVQKNAYQDSITLMLLTNKISTAEGVAKVSIMMGTAANKAIFASGGLATPELDAAGPNDIAIVLDIEEESVVPGVLAAIEDFLSRQGQKGGEGQAEAAVNTWEKALAAAPNANLVLFSIPGVYVETEAETALEAGKHVFIFSDNVTLEAEKRLKDKASALGLLLMGPDCGTALLGGLPLAFTNVVPSGTIGLVGASGTGLQEISTQIARRGAGVSQIIGTGGRDVSELINASTMKMAIFALAHDPNTECLVVVGKPPAAKVKEEILSLLRAVPKPVVVHLVGESFPAHEQGLYYADSLEEAAELAVLLSRGQNAAGCAPLVLEAPGLPGKKIRGLYTGGTLAGEAAALINKALKSAVDLHNHPDGFMFHHDGHQVVDLGDDVYTQGKPHPMIDPQNRLNFIREAAADASVGVILLDLVLGYGANDDMAGSLASAIREAIDTAKAAGRTLQCIASVCGTDLDPQNMGEQKRILAEAGVLVAPSNAAAVATALHVIEYALPWTEKSVGKTRGSRAEAVPPAAPKVLELLKSPPLPINVGLRTFIRPFADQGRPYVQFDWRPLAGGDVELQNILNFLNRYQGEI